MRRPCYFFLNQDGELLTGIDHFKAVCSEYPRKVDLRTSSLVLHEMLPFSCLMQCSDNCVWKKNGMPSVIFVCPTKTLWANMFNSHQTCVVSWLARLFLSWISAKLRNSSVIYFMPRGILTIIDGYENATSEIISRAWRSYRSFFCAWKLGALVAG